MSKNVGNDEGASRGPYARPVSELVSREPCLSYTTLAVRTLRIWPLRTINDRMGLRAKGPVFA